MVAKRTKFTQYNNKNRSIVYSAKHQEFFKNRLALYYEGNLLDTHNIMTFDTFVMYYLNHILLV